MKFLFIDESYRKDKRYFGYGGFCIDEANVKALADDIIKLKGRYKIPRGIELKWSPERNHYFRRNFKGNRQKLYKDAILLLHKYKTTIICAVHDLNECYGMRLYCWDIKRAILWAAKQQIKFLAERFEKPYLEKNNDIGLVIADHYSDKRDETIVIKEIDFLLHYGTEFQSFKKICMIPMMTLSEYCPPVQLADLIIGIVIGALAGSRYALELYEDIALLFLKDPHENAISFSSVYSSSVLGFGLKLFPRSFIAKGLKIFTQINKKYIYTNEGIKLKN
jgi:hypothetical protein